MRTSEKSLLCLHDCILAYLTHYLTGSLCCLCAGLCGSVFPDHFEEAFTGLRVAQGLGGAFSMAYAPFFCMAVKIYVMIVVAVIVFFGYTGAEVLIRREQRNQKQFQYEKEVI